MRRAAVYGSTFLVGASAIGGTASWFATRRAFAAHPPSGRLVEVGEHRLHLDCVGNGDITVVFESALGGWSIDWAQLQPIVAQHTRVCSYDRAGYGWSDPSHRRSAPSAVADELRSLLQAADVPAPYLLVGHSAGGLYVRHFAARYADEVAGMVLVDPFHEHLLGRYPEDSDAVQQTANLKYLRWARYLAITGVTRLLSAPVASSPDLLEPQRAVASAIGYRYDRYEAFYNEAAALVYATRDSDTDLPPSHVPVIVLTSTKNADDPTTGSIWVDLHKEIAATSPRGDQRLIESGHFIQVDRPQAVLDAILDILRQR